MTLHALPDGTEVALIEGDTHISQWVKEAGRLDHDQSTLPILGKYIPLGGMVIDVGAYIGDHTVFYAKAVGPEGAVIAFEPNQRAYDCLLHNTTGLPVRCIHAAASDEYTSIDMVQDRNAGASYAKPGEAIRCARIDDMGLGECHFIKMDCEGMEPKALMGAKETITRCRPVMCIEVNAGALARQGFTTDAIFDIMDRWGYSYTNIHDGHPMNGDQFDILCRPK